MDAANWTYVSPAGAPDYHVYSKPVHKSPSDDRDYSVIKLKNGLHATVVHDAKADKAAASLDVAVGHLYDPDDMPGLAHFCEHLLFMGTEQYPKENDYAEFLAKNNGSSNAYTSTSNTNYYFNVSTSALAPTLSRFSAFFHSPLFSPSCTVRELNAVDSEHKKNHQSDPWRIFQLNKHLSRPGHVWSKFGSGNKDTLTKAAKQLHAAGRLTNGQLSEPSSKSELLETPEISRPPSTTPSFNETDDGGPVGRETRRRLVEWWEKEYCANRMRLCVIGKEPLKELEELVSANFSAIPNRNRDPLPLITEHPFGSEEKGTLISVDTIMRFHAVEISFPLPYQAPHWKHKPADLVSHFVGHEGPGSLHAYLKNKGWITGLSSGPQNLGRGFAMFKITIHLTTDGFKQYRDVMLASFKYLSLLRASHFDHYHQHETHQVSAIQFRFQEKKRPDDYATWISEHMAWPAPPDLVLTAPRLVWEWETENERQTGYKLLREVLDGLTVENSRTVLMAKADEHAELQKSEVKWDQEPIYGTKFHVARLGDEFVSKAVSANDIPELFLPPPNEFIPSNLEVGKRETEQILKRPHLIRETSLSSLWHKKDDRFWVPKATVIVEMRSPVANASPLASVLTSLYSDLVRDALNEFTYAAELAGISYNFAPATNGLYTTMSGYNDKLATLTHHVLEKVKNLTIDPKRLDVMKEQAQRDWENFALSQSYQLSDYRARYLLTHKQWTVEEKLQALPSANPDNLKAHIVDMLSQMHLRILVNGNLYKDEAIKIAEIAEANLGVCSTPLAELDDLSLILPPASNFAWMVDSPNPNQPNSALSYYMYLGSGLDALHRVKSSLLAQILSEPAFNVLRTQEQLGYIVHCSLWNQAGGTHKGVRIIVQSEKTPSYLEGRVEVFLSSMKQMISDMPEATFSEQKAGLEKKWREADKNLSEETNRFWAHIGTGLNDFYRRENDANLLQQVTQKDILDLFSSHVDPSSTSRSKLSVHLRSTKPKPQCVTPAAASAFQTLLESQGKVKSGSSPSNFADQTNIVLSDFLQSWSAVLIENNVSQDSLPGVLEQLGPILEQHPPVEDEVSLQGITYISDELQFKDGLKVSEPPKPVVEWGDLPISKF